MKLLSVLNNRSVLNRAYMSSACAKQNEAQVDITNLQTFEGLNCLANYNKSNISFNGYYGDIQPAKKLFWILTGRNHIFRDEDIENSSWRINGHKKWTTMAPWDLLKRTPEQAIQAICTLNNAYYIPDLILSPNYGDTWGRRANYIEINPRLLAKVEGNRVQEGLLNTIKLLPAIPPSSKTVPNCVVLSQLYPTINGDGYTGWNNSLYTVNLHSGISKNLVSEALSRDGQKMGDDEMVKAFNDLAHIRNIKTMFRMPLSEGQIRVQGRDFNWYSETEAYIDACVWGIQLGFDGIFFDSGKHVGNWDMENYYGCGSLPDYQKMQYITDQIRRRSGRNDLSFVAEKADLDSRFEKLGYSAGTDWGRADNYESVIHEYKKQEWNSNYATGPIISDDNDNGHLSYSDRLKRIGNALHAYYRADKKLPVFFQMHDIFPINGTESTHNLMINSINKTSDGSIFSHYDNIFERNNSAREHTMNVYREFADVFNG